MPSVRPLAPRASHRKLVLHAPAKVNLYLRVVGRRRDGYHLLESLMAPLSLCDRVVLRTRRAHEVVLRCSDPDLPQDRGNLAWEAASLLRELCGVSAGVEIRLGKVIPAGAGLGGGSTDAASVLLGLNKLWRLGLTSAKLATIASRLGADVPFFIHGGPAVVRGIGERVQPCRSLGRVHLVLVWPGFPIETRWVYQNLHWAPPHRRPASPLSAFFAGRRSLVSILHNDLEPVAVSAHPRLREIQRALRRLGAEGTLMTGSGSAVFGLFASQSAARRAATKARAAGLWAAAAHTLDRLPPPILAPLRREAPRIR